MFPRLCCPGCPPALCVALDSQDATRAGKMIINPNLSSTLPTSLSTLLPFPTSPLPQSLPYIPLDPYPEALPYNSLDLRAASVSLHPLNPTPSLSGLSWSVTLRPGSSPRYQV